MQPLSLSARPKHINENAPIDTVHFEINCMRDQRIESKLPKQNTPMGSPLRARTFQRVDFSGRLG